MTTSQDAQLDALIDAASITTNRALVKRILGAGLALGQENTSRLDLKITSAAIAELHAAFRLFQPYEGIPKVSVFGSARTATDDPHYARARDVAHALAAEGWMVVTGAGPGIMQAATEGAGEDNALGVSIRLPFEEKPSGATAADSHRVEMKYFFTRKLMLIKESHGFICLPGGFGTMDEMFELLTLQQTGKAEPTPVVLLDEAGGTFWRGLERFVREDMAPAGVISPDDFERVLVTDSVEAAVAHILGFWRNYHSLRWVGEQLVLRLRHVPSSQEVAQLNADFGGLLVSGEIAISEPLDDERADDDHLELPRLVLNLAHRQVGSLYRLIGAINELPSATYSA